MSFLVLLQNEVMEVAFSDWYSFLEVNIKKGELLVLHCSKFCEESHLFPSATEQKSAKCFRRQKVNASEI